MRGNPIVELLLLLGFVVLLSLPLFHLSRQSHGQLRPAVFQSPSQEGISAWIELKMSHLPTSITLSTRGVEIPLLGTDLYRPEAEAYLKPIDGKLSVAVDVEWPPDIREAYVEVGIEAGAMQRLTEGFWSRGRTSHLLEFSVEVDE